jgi:hypothetical protein
MVERYPFHSGNLVCMNMPGGATMYYGVATTSLSGTTSLTTNHHMIVVVYSQFLAGPTILVAENSFYNMNIPVECRIQRLAV